MSTLIEILKNGFLVGGTVGTVGTAVQTVITHALRGSLSAIVGM